jgi:hypothetical protein
LSGNIYESNAERLPSSWCVALDLFEKSDFIEKYLGADFKKIYLACKHQEKDEIEARVSSIEHDCLSEGRMSRIEHTGSYYAATAHPQPERPPLQGMKSVMSASSGAGFAGISTALHLAERGRK